MGAVLLRRTHGNDDDLFSFYGIVDVGPGQFLVTMFGEMFVAHIFPLLIQYVPNLGSIKMMAEQGPPA